MVSGTAPVVGPTESPVAAGGRTVLSPRLARHQIVLDDGHQVGVAICGRGVPLVAVHGFTAEGILYAQTLSRLVGLGFKVVAVDTAGHGGTIGLPTDANNLARYAELLARALDHLGVGPAVLMGHSMGGRLVTELAATEPHRAIGVISLDGVIGSVWDRRVNLGRVFPPYLLGLGGLLAADTMTTVPLLRDPTQARKLGHLVAPTLAGHARRPWRLVAPAVSILRSRGTGWMLDRLRQERIPLFAVNGDRDLVVPVSTARAAARRAHGELVVVEGASHSWLLKDPESLPAIIHQLMKGRLGTAVLRAVMKAGVDPSPTLVDAAEAVEAALYQPGSLALALTPGVGEVDELAVQHRQPRYAFAVHPTG